MGAVRVLQLVAGLDIGNSAGGAEAFALRLAQLVERTRCTPAVFALWRRESAIEAEWLARLAAAGIPVYGLISPRGCLPLDLTRAAHALWQAVGAFRPHVINSHSERGDLLNLWVKAMHPRHPAAVQTVHIDQQWVTQPLFGPLFNHVAAPAGFDRQVAVAATIQSMLAARPLARLSKRRVELVYNGIDGAAFESTIAGAEPDRSAGCTPAGTDEEPWRIGVVGRLTEQKGHSDLLQAIAWVRQVLPVKLVIVGDGPLDAALRAQADALGIAACVDFLGRRDDVAALLPTFDVLVSASLWEGFPTVLLEAMAARVPVAATDVSGSRELVRTGETGILAPPRAPRQLAAALIALLANRPLAAAMAARAYDHARCYTMQRTAQMYTQLYRDIAETRRTRQIHRASRR